MEGTVEKTANSEHSDSISCDGSKHERDIDYEATKSMLLKDIDSRQSLQRKRKVHCEEIIRLLKELETAQTEKNYSVKFILVIQFNQSYK